MRSGIGTDGGIDGSGCEAGWFCDEADGGDEANDGDDNGNATLLFKFIFKFPVAGGMNFGGSFQPGGAGGGATIKLWNSRHFSKCKTTQNSPDILSLYLNAWKMENYLQYRIIEAVKTKTL